MTTSQENPEFSARRANWHPPLHPGPCECDEEIDRWWDDEKQEPCHDGHRQKRDLPALSTTAQHDITKEMLRSSEALFSNLLLRCLVYDSDFFNAASQFLNLDAKIQTTTHNDFSNPVDGLIYAAMSEFSRASISKIPLPSNPVQWIEAIKPHLNSFLSKNPEFPRFFEQQAVELISSLVPPAHGDLSRAYDGLIDYIRDVRLKQAAALFSTMDPANKFTCIAAVSASVKIPSAIERWHCLTSLGDPEPLDTLIAGTLYAKTAAMLFGPPGSGKTFVALDIAAAVASGQPWNSLPTKKAGVLYYCLEGGGGVRNRVRALLRQGVLKLSDPFAFCTDSLDLRSPETCSKICDDTVLNSGEFKLPVELIVIDTLAAATAGGNECTSEDMGKALATIADVVKVTGATVLLLHHPGKDRNKGPRGWSGIVGNLDTIFEVERKETIRTFKIKKQKDGEDGKEMGFELTPVEWMVPGGRVTSCITTWLSQEEETKRAARDHAAHFETLFRERQNAKICTREIAKILGWTCTGSTRTNQVGALMSILTNMGWVSPAEAGPHGSRQWVITDKGRGHLASAFTKPAV